MHRVYKEKKIVVAFFLFIFFACFSSEFGRSRRSCAPYLAKKSCTAAKRFWSVTDTPRAIKLRTFRRARFFSGVITSVFAEASFLSPVALSVFVLCSALRLRVGCSGTVIFRRAAAAAATGGFRLALAVSRCPSSVQVRHHVVLIAVPAHRPRVGALRAQRPVLSAAPVLHTDAACRLFNLLWRLIRLLETSFSLS